MMGLLSGGKRKRKFLQNRKKKKKKKSSHAEEGGTTDKTEGKRTFFRGRRSLRGRDSYAPKEKRANGGTNLSVMQ